jgi:nuclear transport factor 2 (NTF2) superfamily protein
MNTNMKPNMKQRPNLNFDIEHEEIRQPVPAFTLASAQEKVRKAENGWNSQDPVKVATAYSLTSVWRNRDTFLQGRPAIVKFLADKWQREQEYRLIKELWAFDGERIAVRFAYEWLDAQGQWFRSYGNENWQFNDKGLMVERHASINDVKITEKERKFHWPQGSRPAEHPGLTELGL